MKILVVSNLYPPCYIGGYELRCALVAEGLRRAGHEVRVLTSRFGLGSAATLEENINSVWVQRVLGQYNLGPQDPVGRPYFLAMIRPQIRDVKSFNRVLEEFRPDLVNWWSVRGLTKAILSIPKRRGIPDVYFIEEPWIVEEQARGELDQRPPWTALWAKERKSWYWKVCFLWLVEIWRKGLCRQGIDTGTVDFSPTHVCFVSEFLRDDFRQAGIEYPSTEIIYGGVDAAKFFYQRESVDAVTDPLRLLYAGQITWDRGLQTVIDALSLLSREVLTHTTLTVVGDGFEPIFPRNMRQKVEDLGLSKQVIFVGKRSYDQMPEIYRCHDVLIAPSLRKEGLPLTMTEAMLSGCAVVTSGSGGAIEIAQMAGLPLFPKGNAPALSEILENLILDRQRVEQIGRRGQRVAMREFSSDRMVQRVCQTFEQLFQAHSKGEPSKNPIPDYHQQFDPTASRSSS